MDQKAEGPEDLAFVPLGTPLIAGPGALSVVIINVTTIDLGMTILALLAVMLVTFVILIRADIIFRVIGQAGVRALTRVPGLITTAYAIQMILDGVSGYVASL